MSEQKNLLSPCLVLYFYRAYHALPERKKLTEKEWWSQIQWPVERMEYFERLEENIQYLEGMLL